MSDDLGARFGTTKVFMDVDAIQVGRDFRKAIHENVGECSILLAIIGSEWVDARSADGVRRLDSDSDYVRLEIAAALRRDIPVVPVLVRGAHMPYADQLPEDIRDLAYRNAVELTHARWKSDVQVLSQALAPSMEEAPASAPSQAQAVPETRPVSQNASTPTSLDRAVMDRVIHELASYIGPIAELVVKRAARRCNSLAELCNVVAQEIDGDADRASFVASCRR